MLRLRSSRGWGAGSAGAAAGVSGLSGERAVVTQSLPCSGCSRAQLLASSEARRGQMSDRGKRLYRTMLCRSPTNGSTTCNWPASTGTHKWRESTRRPRSTDPLCHANSPYDLRQPDQCSTGWIGEPQLSFCEGSEASRQGQAQIHSVSVRARGKPRIQLCRLPAEGLPLPLQ